MNLTGEKTHDGLTYWRPFFGSTKKITQYSYRSLRGRAVRAFFEQPLVRAMVYTLANSVIHTGIKLQARPDSTILRKNENYLSGWSKEVEARFNLWAEKNRFFEKQYSLYLSSKIMGDALLFFGIYEKELVLNISDSEIIDSGHNQDDFINGVENYKNGNVSRIKLENKGKIISRFDRESGRENFILFFRPEVIGQARGYPACFPILQTLKSYDRFVDAETESAVLNACLFGAVKSSSLGNSGSIFERKIKTSDQKEKEGLTVAQSKTFANLKPDEEVQIFDTKRPSPVMNDYFTNIVSLVGASMGLPPSFILKKFDSNYSASRGEVIEAMKTIEVERKFFIKRVCDVVYQEFLQREILSGRIEAKGFLTDRITRSAWLKTLWQEPVQDHIDPSKQIKALVDKINNGLISRSEVAESLGGGDFVSIMERALNDEEMFRRVFPIKVKGVKK